MNKRGQFFLIAALVIAGIIITLTTINISTKTPEVKTTALYDLSKEIDYESSSLIDYGVYQSTSITGSIDSLMANYSAANPDTDLIFIYGDPSEVTIASYTLNESGMVGMAGVYNTVMKKFYSENKTTGDKATVNLGEDKLDFNLEQGQNFFIVLKKQSGEETIVARNPNE